MADWKSCRNCGAWAFTPQPNKWGYLNDPRWVNPSVGPLNYDAGGEPQVFTPPGDPQSSGGRAVHNPCGHWHRFAYTAAPTTPAPVVYMPWYSCPEGIIPLGDQENAEFITTDNLGLISGITNLFVMDYDRSTGLWTTIHTDTEAFADQWFEPDIGLAWSGNIKVIALTKPSKVYALQDCVQVLVFNGTTLLNDTIIEFDTSLPYGYLWDVTAMCQASWVLIDNTGHIHIYCSTYKTNYHTYDFISTDNGATFTPVQVDNVSTLYSYLRFIKQHSAGVLRAYQDMTYRQSNDNGATWGADVALSNFSGQPISYIENLNSLYFGVAIEGSSFPFNDIDILRSTDGINFTTVHVVPNIFQFLAGAAFTFDGTYYYCALMFRNLYGPKSPGYAYVYRSADGITWAQVGGVTDYGYLGTFTNRTRRQFWPTQLLYSDGTLFLFYYYGAVNLIAPNTYKIVYWYSKDLGVTWTPVETPFYDLTIPGSVLPS